MFAKFAHIAPFCANARLMTTRRSLLGRNLPSSLSSGLDSSRTYFAVLTAEPRAVAPIITRSFHASVPTLAKGGKGGKEGGKGGGGGGGKKGAKGGKGGDDDDDDDDDAPAAVVLPDMNAFNAKMEKSIQRLSEDFGKMRGGAIRSDMFNHLTVQLDAPSGGGAAAGAGAASSSSAGAAPKAGGGGSSSHLNILEVGQITMVNSLRFDISVYDPNLMTAVGNAIRDSGLGVTPAKGERDNIWTIKVNKPSKEAREALVKVAATRCEKTKMDLRTIRKDILDKVKGLKGKAGDDDLKRLTKEIETLNDKAAEKVGKLLKAKETELMA
jgi:ribosome recycling factor